MPWFLRIGRHFLGRRIIRRHGRAVGIGIVGEPGARIRIDVILFDLPVVELVFLRKDVIHFHVGAGAIETTSAPRQTQAKKTRQEQNQR